jgi:hypothetical protein
MQHIRRIDSDNGNPFYEINVGSISGYPAPIVYCEASKDGLNIKTEHLKSFTYNGVEYTNDYLKEHATAMFTKVIAAATSNEKEKFSALVACLGVSEEKANKLWKFVKPALKWLDKLTVKKAARILNFISFGKAIDKKSAKERGVSPGGDIMIHGYPNKVPSFMARFLKNRDWTQGCIAVSDDEIEEIWDLVANNTPIKILP